VRPFMEGGNLRAWNGSPGNRDGSEWNRRRHSWVTAGLKRSCPIGRFRFIAMRNRPASMNDEPLFRQVTPARRHRPISRVLR
jgi:hypothetical protein